MTLDQALRLLGMLTDTIDAQQRQIDALLAQLAERASNETPDADMAEQ